MQVDNNLFKNSGIRGKVEQSFITPNNMLTLGYAIGYFFAKNFQKPINIIIATDTRSSGKWIKQELIQGLSNFGNQLFDAGIAPTPFLAKALKNYKDSKSSSFFQLGIMITASHNPAEYNGIKVMTPHGYLDHKTEKAISEIFAKYIQDIHEIHIPIKSTLQKIDLLEFYQRNTQTLIKTKKFNQLKIVIDCAHGATYKVAQTLFESFGITTIPINNSSNGSIINHMSGCGDPKLLTQAIQNYQAHWGCAFDGDGDRVIIVDQTGKVFDGDDLLVVLSQHPLIRSNNTVIGTIMNNLAVEQYFSALHKTFIRTDVGEKNLIQALKQHNAIIGSEPCGHITITKHALCSDGIFAALLFFDTLQQQSLADINVPVKLPQIHTTIPLGQQNIQDSTIQELIQSHIDIVNPGRIIARKSNTEPVIRIMIEHPNIQEAKQIMALFTKQCKRHLDKGSKL